MLKTSPIILVEDDQDDQELITMALKQINADKELIIFYNGAEALRYLQTTPDKPFLILCDVNMPVMNGLELIREIHHDDKLRRKSIPFVFLSTSGERGPVNKAYDLMVQGFFKKPDTMNELRGILQLMLDYWNTSLHPDKIN